jgi:hypothetical protein
MATKRISDVKVNLFCGNDTYAVRRCGPDGNRYHVFTDKGGQLRTSHGSKRILYKNPPLGIERGDARCFETRYLSVSTKDNHTAIATAIDFAKSNGLYAAAREAKAVEDAAEQAVRDQNRQKEAVRNAAPQLLNILDRLQKAAKVVCDLSHAGRTWAQMSAELSELYNARNDAYATIEAAKKV